MSAAWSSAYEDTHRVLRHHQVLMRAMRPCLHGLGLNRPYPQDGCNYCFSRRIADRCLAMMEHLTEVAA
jgi:hypothetical protein